ncbi:MAG TPA: hypothetical protein PLW93_01435 [Candidatus Absconditabacterales bacterium]|nr:hypothetical protein [Candidatus Absconditabacterales bacterium]HNG96915.1 hypothetical protein [Candidatus Absconditabacterales bacterium]
MNNNNQIPSNDRQISLTTMDDGIKMILVMLFLGTTINMRNEFTGVAHHGSIGEFNGGQWAKNIQEYNQKYYQSSMKQSVCDTLGGIDCQE